MESLRFTVALKRVWLWTLPVGAYSMLTLLRYHEPFKYVPSLPVQLDAALSFAMGLLIAFRVNRAYERWWEARILWGSLVNVSRNLAVKIDRMVSPDDADRTMSRDCIIEFCYALKDHLRDEPQPERLSGLLEHPQDVKHIPSFIAGKIYERMAQWEHEERISGEDLIVIDREARVLLEICGACERIKNTLMSVSWRRFTQQIIFAYLIVFPWAIADEFANWTVPLSMVVAYFVMAGEAIAQYVEEPFGEHEDHLDLDAICGAIKSTVSEILTKR